MYTTKLIIIKIGRFNEEMMESLFGYTAVAANKGDRKKDLALDPSAQFIQIIDAKKAQNLSILLRALNVTTAEVLDALEEGTLSFLFLNPTCFCVMLVI